MLDTLLMRLAPEYFDVPALSNIISDCQDFIVRIFWILLQTYQSESKQMTDVNPPSPSRFR